MTTDESCKMEVNTVDSEYERDTYASASASSPGFLSANFKLQLDVIIAVDDPRRIEDRNKYIVL